MLERLQRAHLIWPTVLTIVALGILGALGTWQLGRKIWKDTLVLSINARLAEAPQAVRAEVLMAQGVAQLPV